MAEVAGAVIATSLVLVAVFVPVALFPGTTGRLYKQFSLTIAFSVALSAFNALTLTPALSALLLKHQALAQGSFFRAINRAIDATTRAYQRTLSGVLHHRAITMFLFAGGLLATVLLYAHVPTGFVPDEDQGYFIVMIQAPPGGSLQNTISVTKQIEKILQQQPEVADMFNVNGFSFVGNGGNKAIVFVQVTPIAERKGPEHSIEAVLDRLRPQLMSMTGAMVIPFGPPALQGVGSIGGFSLEAAGSRRQHHRCAGQGDAGRRRRGVEGQGAGRHVRGLHRRRSAAPGLDRSREGQEPAESRSTKSPTPCRSTWARPTSTTSTSTTAPIASTCRRIAQFRSQPKDIQPVLRARDVGPDDPARLRGAHQDHHGAADDQPLQLVPQLRDQRRVGARFLDGTGP